MSQIKSIVFIIFLLSALGINLVSAQQVVTNITPDSTLPTNSMVNENGNVFNITEGTSVGSNLFHSFQEFNVASGDVANFVDPGGIANILSRVTGDNVSNIFGQLRSDSSANLYFFNPNGVVFGPNSSLDVGGSFHMSTADFIRLGEGSGLFSASDPASDVLIAAPPSEFGFLPGNVNAGSVEIQGLRHENPGQALEIIGGNIVIRNGTLTVPGGDILLTGDNVTVTDGATIFSDATDNLNGGNININVSGKVLLENSSKISSTSIGSTDTGSLNIVAQNILFQSGSLVSTSSLGTGDSGRVDIAATGNITLTDTDITTETRNGEGGDILIDGSDKTILDSTTLSTFAGPEGHAGDIIIQGSRVNSSDASLGKEQLLIQNGSRIATESFGFGNAGVILLETKGTLRLRDSGILATAFLSTGGNIKLNASFMIHLLNSIVESAVSGDETTVGATISLDPEFILLQKSQVLASQNAGIGGPINFIGDFILIDTQSVIDSSSSIGFSGNLFSNLSESLALLPETIIAPITLYSEQCAAQKSGRFSSLRIRGRDRIPPEPGDYLWTPVQANVMPSSMSGSAGASSTSMAAHQFGHTKLEFQKSSVDPMTSFDHNASSLTLFNSGC